MASDPTQTQAQTRRPDSPAAREWYVVTGGSSALRMTRGLTVGESESGALTLNDPQLANQWIEFVLADNGEPWATITIRDKSLRVAGSTCLRHPLQVGTTVRLPNNTLHISRDIRMPPLSGIVVEVVHREVPGRPQLVVGPELEQALTTGPETRPDTTAAEIPEPFDPMTAEAGPAPDPDARDYWSDDTLTVAEPQRPRSGARRRQVAVMAGALALGAVTLAGVLAMLVSMSGRETARVADLDPVPVETPAASSPAEAPRPAGSSGDVPPLPTEPVPPPADVADAGSGGQASPVTPSPSGSSDAVPADTLAAGEPAETMGEPGGTPAQPPSATPETADSGSPQAADATAPAEPDAATADEPEQVAMLPRAEQEPLAPIAAPSMERRSLPPAPASGSAAAAAADPQTRDGQPGTPDATVAAEPEQITESPREPAPQPVRDGLINSAMAQLAGGALDDARRSLEAAADAGVNPQLIADLRGEVDYRQRLIDAEAGRFDTLYPIDQLVAVSQEPPSVPRFASIGDEVSVEAQFTVTASGNVNDVIVLDAPPERLAQAVRRAVSEWRFEPVLYNGRPLPVRSSVRFTFQN